MNRSNSVCLQVKETRKNKENGGKTICPLCKKDVDIYIYKFHLAAHPSKVYDYLYLGNHRNANEKEELKVLGIKYVLNCAKE